MSDHQEAVWRQETSRQIREYEKRYSTISEKCWLSLSRTLTTPPSRGSK